MDAKTLKEGKRLDKSCVDAEEYLVRMGSLTAERKLGEAEEKMRDWLWTYKDELIADAGRLETLIAGFRIMSPKMDGNHVWTWSHHPKLIGPNMKAAIDAAMGDKR